MKILITGATGFIGLRLAKTLVDAGHEVVAVTRSRTKAQAIIDFKAEFVECDLNKEALSAEQFFGVNTVINLAGESVDGRWSREKKKNILNSRVMAARNLLKNCPVTVKTVITASAQGIYGDRGDEILTEQSELADLAEPGKGFLAEVCRQWEAEFQQRPQRVLILRLGMVLSKEGGALHKLLPLFKKNLGAPLGNGKQWISYISLNDLIRVVQTAISDTTYSGVINVVNNNPVTNAEFTHALCAALKVWCLPNVPAGVLRLMLGEMSELVLSSLRVKPQKLNEYGFKFQDETLASILASI